MTGGDKVRKGEREGESTEEAPEGNSEMCIVK